MNTTTRDPNDGIRRFLADLRSSFDRRAWKDRRKGERHGSAQAAEQDQSSDRRVKPERRVVLTDRRRRIADTFVREDADRIKKMVLDTSVVVGCPRCDGNLLLGPPVTRDGSVVRQVHCTACRHGVVITDLPGHPFEVT
ncbi:MAG: hypothetical protein O7I93_09335 [Gemmatimonadetes bacterium]|nr:hypothetical protein [Gemmatimonadota bacterium]